MEPIRGNAFFVMESKVILSFDVLFGGAGKDFSRWMAGVYGIEQI
jgi:flagellar motor switch protein FliM